jgi:hypothetical protein
LPIDSSSKIGGEVTSRFVPGSFTELLLEMFSAVNGLYAEHGLTRDENDAMTQQVSSYMKTFMNG